MGLETATYISGLVATNPTGSDQKSTGDDHLRLIKSTLLATFPNVTGEVTATHTQINQATGNVFAYKTAATARDSTITLAADPHLVLALTSGVWAITGFLAVGNVLTADTNGLKYDFSYSGTVTEGWFARAGIINNAAMSAYQAQAYGEVSTFSELFPFQVTTADFINISGTLKVTNSGNLSFRWAQNSSTTTSTSIDAGSWLRAFKLS